MANRYQGRGFPWYYQFKRTIDGPAIFSFLFFFFFFFLEQTINISGLAANKLYSSSKEKYSRCGY